jgi:predicted transcriptional regulator
VSGLWGRTNAHAGIDRKLFFEYFAGCQIAHAIAIGDVRRYKRPLELQKDFGVRPPQSFLYLACEDVIRAPR